jgi:hypothetical protein
LQVQYLNTEDVLIQNLTLRNFITVTDLKPHRNYTFTVVVRSGTESQVLRRSLPVSAIFTTMESVPGKVRSDWRWVASFTAMLLIVTFYYKLLMNTDFIPEFPLLDVNVSLPQSFMFFINKSHYFLNLEYETIIPIKNLLEYVCF